MNSTFFQQWLNEQPFTDKSIQTRTSHGRRVEEHYGDLDDHYNQDQLRSVVKELKYSVQDERLNRPNPSRIPINGNIRNSLASYKAAVEIYCKFRREIDSGEFEHMPSTPTSDENNAPNERGQLIGLERDMQAALRRSIEQLDPGLEIIDDGAERSVSSGFIDITATDTDGSIVAIELKTGTARRDAVGQILSYMGDLAEEEPETNVRGILVAGDFDKKARAAARMVPSLSLRTYRVNFEFADGENPSAD